VLDVILYQPEIPPNTGNVIRLAANTGVRLHLVGPLGFSMEDRLLRRAGLDYHEWAEVRLHESIDACLGHLEGPRVFAITTRGARLYTEPAYEPGDALLFGPETRGLPQSVLESLPQERRLLIPMRPGNRSLNLSNAVAVLVYEAWRQWSFQGAMRP
jgi:tRNA (cytidine/uridine-2'-O-)-methyltransferase